MLKSMNFLSGKSRGIFKTSPLEGEVGASLRVRGITNTTTNAKSAPLAPVILGLVHKSSGNKSLTKSINLPYY